MCRQLDRQRVQTANNLRKQQTVVLRASRETAGGTRRKAVPIHLFPGLNTRAKMLKTSVAEKNARGTAVRWETGLAVVVSL